MRSIITPRWVGGRRTGGVGVGEMHENYWEVYERFAFAADLVCSFLFLLLSIYLLPVLI